MEKDKLFFDKHYRVEEAKKLLTSSTIEQLNILGIAFAAGFDSKIAFNTTFKKLWVYGSRELLTPFFQHLTHL